MKNQKKHHRPAWVEINLGRLENNFVLINADRPRHLKFLTVVKDQAYGHGAIEISQAALRAGASYLGVVTLDEALQLRQNKIQAPILIFGERSQDEIATSISNSLTCCINDKMIALSAIETARKLKKNLTIHIEIDTGMSRYGIRWDEAAEFITFIAQIPEFNFEGIFTHFAMSDETDKSYAMLQLERFNTLLSEIRKKDISVQLLHASNTGGFLDLPMANFDMVRMGILPLGVYPSKVCRRIPGLLPVMSVKSKIAAIRDLKIGDKVGYGMRYTAETPRRIAVLPLGYGDGYPRVRNRGEVLVHGKRAPIIGGNAMDAMMVDITHIPESRQWDEVVIMGNQGEEEISVHEIAELKGSVSYDILTGWRSRLPRIYVRGID
ncbi:MAG: alanine racemase [Calditrichaeota bacterium]|nr:MAG: alanine racemase [Calditrichota bacterium]